MLITLTPALSLKGEGIFAYPCQAPSRERGYLPTLVSSLKGEGVSCLVDEPVSQIIERPWGAGLKPTPVSWYGAGSTIRRL